MRLEDELLQSTTARTFLRDLHDHAVARRAEGQGAPALDDAWSDLGHAWGTRPSADLRRFAVVATDTLGDATFAVQPLDETPNRWEQLFARAAAGTHHGGDVLLALHHALPLGSLTRGGHRLWIGLLLEDTFGLKAGRVVAVGPGVRGALARLEKRLGTFALRLAQAQDGTSVYATRPLETFATPNTWLGAALQGHADPLDLTPGALAQLAPPIDAAFLASGRAARLHALWRSWLCGEEGLLAESLAATEGGTGLEQDAAALVLDLRDGRDAVGPRTGLQALREAWTDRLATARTAAGEVDSAVQIAVDWREPPLAAAPEPPSEPESRPEPKPAPEPASQPALEPQPEPQPDADPDSRPVTGPGGPDWPASNEPFRKPVSIPKRFGLYLAGAAFALGFLGLCCGGVS